jgi:hypothetical protein
MNCFNKCIPLEQISQAWRYSSVKILYKGKEDTECQHNYRGIMLENMFRIFMKVLAKRLPEEVDSYLTETSLVLVWL